MRRPFDQQSYAYEHRAYSNHYPPHPYYDSDYYYYSNLYPRPTFERPRRSDLLFQHRSVVFSSPHECQDAVSLFKIRQIHCFVASVNYVVVETSFHRTV